MGKSSYGPRTASVSSAGIRISSWRTGRSERSGYERFPDATVSAWSASLRARKWFRSSRRIKRPTPVQMALSAMLKLGQTCSRPPLTKYHLIQSRTPFKKARSWRRALGLHLEQLKHGLLGPQIEPEDQGSSKNEKGDPEGAGAALVVHGRQMINAHLETMNKDFLRRWRDGCKVYFGALSISKASEKILEAPARSRPAASLRPAAMRA